MGNEKRIGAGSLKGPSEPHGRVLPAGWFLVEHLEVPANPLNPDVKAEDCLECDGKYQQREKSCDRKLRQRRGRHRQGPPANHSGDQDPGLGRPALADRLP